MLDPTPAVGSSHSPEVALGTLCSVTWTRLEPIFHPPYLRVRDYEYVQDCHRWTASRRWQDHDTASVYLRSAAVWDTAATEMIGETEMLGWAGHGSHWRQATIDSEFGGEATEMQMVAPAAMPCNA